MDRDLYTIWWGKFSHLENKKNYIVPVQNQYFVQLKQHNNFY